MNSKQSANKHGLRETLALASARAAALLRGLRSARRQATPAAAHIDPPKRRDSEGMTYLMRAAQDGSAEHVMQLLPVSEANAQNDEGMTALMLAARGGRADCVALLLPASDPSLKDEAGATALSHAGAQGFMNCAQMIHAWEEKLAAQENWRSQRASRSRIAPEPSARSVLGAPPAPRKRPVLKRVKQ